jgi:titin
LNSNRSDRGEYVLRAENKLGEDITSFLVTVTDRPKPPEKIAIKIQLDRTVTLSWSPPEDDGGCKIGTYIIEYFRIGWDVWLKAATSRQLAITLNDLITGSEYKFRVKAENPYGVSDPSEESEVVFVPDPSRGITRDSLNIANAGIGAQKSSQISFRSDKIPTKKLSPLPEIRLNTKIFDDETINRDMAYGTSSNFLHETPVSLKEKSQIANQIQKIKIAKNNVKFKLDSDMDENQPQNATEIAKPEQNESKMTSKKTLSDLSKTCDNNVSSNVQNSTEFMLVLYDKESNNSTSKFSYP